MATPRKTRSQGPAELNDLDHPNSTGHERGSTDIEKELSFYATYHNNSINKLIHMICVPIIMWTSLIFLAYFAAPGTEALVLAKGLAVQPSLAALVAIGYQIYYFVLDAGGALTFLPLTVLLYTTATYLKAFPAGLPLAGHPASAAPLAAVLFVTSWIAQFVGHGVFEKRAPALLTNLTQALVLAPFFVHLEILHTCFGYKADLHKRVKNKAGVRIRDMNRAGKAK